MTVFCTAHCDFSNQQINVPRLIRNAKWLLRKNRMSNTNLSILLVDDQEISHLNSHYRKRRGPTNVLSFPINESSLNELGDIVISIDTAQREAKAKGVTLHYHLTWLITHGLLHLLGYDHERSEQEALAMWDFEQQLLNEAWYEVTLEGD